MAHKDVSLFVEDVDIYRHWDSKSEKFAGGDALATMLLLGWEFNPLVLVDTYWHFGTRQVHVFHFELLRGDEAMSMPVLGNPYIDRLIATNNLRVEEVDRSEKLHIKMPVREKEYARAG